ncbi:MAG TPA: cation-efflux pump [Roseiarcus sp.]|nr:cation-efflux pump [Roseiarcus sp.]
MDEGRLKRRAALMSVAASTGLALLKVAAGVLSGSLALLSEGVHNALDIAASGLTYFAVRIADKPADEGHPFGHAKVEAIAALAQTAFLFALSIGVAALALRRIGAPGEIEAGAFAFLVVLASIVIDIVRWRALSRVAAATGSDAIAADALHYASDLVASALVLVGLAATRAGLPAGDALAAIGVAVFIAFSGFRLGKRTVEALVDAAPEGLANDVRAALGEVGGVVGVDYLRLRRSGAGAVGELGLFVSRTQSLESGAAIKQRAAALIAQRWPRLKLTIAANPRALDDETLLERVLLIAARRRLFVHHVTIQRVGERVTVSLDLEVDGRTPLGAAHEVASRLEQAIAAECGDGVEVDTHIEPMETRELPGRDAEPALTDAVAERLQREARGSPLLCDVHHVRVRASDAGYYGVFHCRADPNATVEAVHDEVDRLERAVRAEFPQIARIIGHAEPG